jgi:release factor glutamine methyltransferase
MKMVDMLARGGERLRGVCENPLGEVRYVLESVWGYERAYQYAHGDEELSEGLSDSFFGLVERRRLGEPLSLIVGRKEFYGRDFEVTRDTLQPRPESEVLVDWVLEWYGSRAAPSYILDLGTGSGCLLISILKAWSLEGRCVRGLGIDRSEKALSVARRNGLHHDVGDVMWMVGSWDEGVACRGEGELLTVSNPPYVKREDREFLSEGVREFEPRLAWDGGEDGLEKIEEIVRREKRVLGCERLFMEIGMGQVDDVRERAEFWGWRWLGSRRDFAGIERIVMCER